MPALLRCLLFVNSSLIKINSGFSKRLHYNHFFRRYKRKSLFSVRRGGIFFDVSVIPTFLICFQNAFLRARICFRRGLVSFPMNARVFNNTRSTACINHFPSNMFHFFNDDVSSCPGLLSELFLASATTISRKPSGFLIKE